MLDQKLESKINDTKNRKKMLEERIKEFENKIMSTNREKLHANNGNDDEDEDESEDED
jgi:hypothetical protein